MLRRFYVDFQIMVNVFRLSILLFGLLPALLHSQSAEPAVPDSLTEGGLIPGSTAMETAWDLPKNPFKDSLALEPRLARQVKRGYRLFTDTREEAPQFAGNGLSCNNCHLNGGQRERAMPLVGVSGVYPEYNKRSGRLLSLEDRIVGCFLRSENAMGSQGERASLPSTQSEEVLALASYITWVSQGQRVGAPIPWRGRNVIEHTLPVNALDPRRGETLYRERCTNCHGEDGQGVEIGDKKAGPLWGPDSWNDGAGAARVYTLAGMIRYMMPYLDPGSLTDEEAQHLAAYINSKPRPVFPWKGEDYPGATPPPDAVYYKRLK
jgi:thiosulfate dehydrogenase